MAVYEGVLEKISDGEVISAEGTGGYFTHRVGITRFHRTGVDPQAGWSSINSSTSAGPGSRT